MSGITSKLHGLIETGRLPHALVIDGGTYDSRLNLATELSCSLLCESPQNRPCGNCPACKKAVAGVHPDVITVLPEEKKKTISVDVIRNMRDDVFILPNESNLKIYIISKAEFMPEYSQNALLKILEEPPAYVHFFLLCSSSSVLLPTVLSRSAVFSMDETENSLSNELSQDAVVQARSILNAVIEKDEIGLLRQVALFEKNYELLGPCLSCMEAVLRDAMALNSGFYELTGPAEEEAHKMSQFFSNAQLFRVSETICDILKSTEIYANKNLTLTRLSSKLMHSVGA